MSTSTPTTSTFLTREIARYAGESPSRAAEAARSTAFTALGVAP
ncbi:hypothetical protein M2359_003821 [Gordonia amarae]|nr:hypothetical protein [Gordonia amarae]MCS3880192.1 hypothetical protein [Gordonia amarae]